jgi:hypothetical protein
MTRDGELWRIPKPTRKLVETRAEKRELANKKPWLSSLPQQAASASNGSELSTADLEALIKTKGLAGYNIRYGQHKRVTVAFCNWKGTYVHFWSGLNRNQMKQLRKNCAAVALLPVPRPSSAPALYTDLLERAGCTWAQLYKWHFRVVPEAWSEVVPKEFHHTKLANGLHVIAIDGLWVWPACHAQKAWALDRMLVSDGLRRSRDSISPETLPRSRRPSPRSASRPCRVFSAPV